DPDGGGNSAYPDSRILLINPDDSVLINQNVPNSELNTIEDYVLPATGQYVIRVMESEGDQAFSYSIILIN
ncbi:MAG: hypothetical protein JW863_15465, partial [Chitinispirillaceae bacterium]|nr:hypothetical protein [Chitinispirillaceae bacterium]